MSRIGRGFLAVSVVVGAVLVAPATAQADPATYQQFRKISSQPGVAQGAEEELLRVVPLGQRQGPQVSDSRTISAEWTVSDSTTMEATLDWAVGRSGEAGVLGSVGVSERVKVDAEVREGFTSSVGVSGRTSIQRTRSASATTTWTVQVSGPAADIRRGYAIYGYSIGTRHTLERRRCYAVPGGGTGNDTCLGWVASGTVFQPTGIGLRLQGLGWTALTFSGKKAPIGQPQPTWITHVDARQIGQPICPTAVGLTLDARNNTYRFGCAYTNIEWTGTYVTSDLRLNAVLDPDSFVANLSGTVTGRVSVVRQPYQPGNTVRPHTLNGIGPMTVAGKGTFRIDNWR